MNRTVENAKASDASFAMPGTVQVNAIAPDDDHALLPVADSRPINILLVDDEHMNLTVLETILDDPSYRLVKADSADQALLALLTEEFALLILDIRMPGATGIELAHMIKQRKKTADIPIIFLTAYYNEDEHVLAGYGVGAVDYLHKPINAEILRSKVGVFTQLYRMQRELKASNENLERRVLARTRELRASASLLKATTDNASVGLASVDLARCYVFANPAYCRIFGLVDDVVRKPLGEVHSTTVMEQTRSFLDRAYVGERTTYELSAGPPIGKTGNAGFYSVVFEPERDSDGNIMGVVIVVFDITERKKSEEHVQLLLREVNHRSKNMLSVVSAIARQTKAPSREEYVKRFSERIHALAASHDLLSSKQWQAIAMTELVNAQLAHFGSLIGTRVTIDGPAVGLSATGAQFLGMVVHELATNAAKHGALSDQLGRVSLSWDIVRMATANWFKVTWIESDGPPVVPPSQRGYGSTVIKTMAELSLDGCVALDFAPSGLVWRLECPIEKILDASTDTQKTTKIPTDMAGNTP